MATRMASDEVTDEIAAIEMHRQGTEQESGLAVSVTEALRKLQALLAQEKEALQQNGPDSVSAINVETVANELRRVQSMVGGRGQRHTQGQSQGQGNGRVRDRQPPRPEKTHNPNNPPRNRGRRKMGRAGGRGGRNGPGGGGPGGGGAGGGGAGGAGGGNAGGGAPGR